VLHDARYTLIGEQLAVLLGGEEAGQDRVDPDVVRRQFARQELRDLVDAPLATAYVNTLESGGPEEAEEMLMMDHRGRHPPWLCRIPGTRGRRS